MFGRSMHFHVTTYLPLSKFDRCGLQHQIKLQKKKKKKVYAKSIHVITPCFHST